MALARALAAQPRVLLLDEPFSALDTDLRAAMHGLLEEVRAILRPTVVMVTHDTGEASMADAVAMLDQGRLAQSGALDELYAAPASRTVARLLGGFAEVPGRLTDRGIRSPMGLLRPVPGRTAPDGLVTALVRQEDVALTGEHDAAASATGVAVRPHGTDAAASPMSWWARRDPRTVPEPRSSRPSGRWGCDRLAVSGSVCG